MINMINRTSRYDGHIESHAQDVGIAKGGA
jgi:hypothetical protein